MQLKTTQKFIEESISMHGDKYEYDSVIYLGGKKHIQIRCGVHGLFSQTPEKHLLGRGCIKCSNNMRKTTKKFIEDAIALHHSMYDYSKVNYLGSFKPVKILCKIHGVFQQRPVDHLSGCGCKKCNMIHKTTNQFITESQKIHGSIYDYSRVYYLGVCTNVDIICKRHGVFSQKPRKHLIGQGCNRCSKYGFDYKKPSKLYYISVNKGQAYKIGVTNNSVADRFLKSELENIDIVTVWDYATGEEAFDQEQKILKEFSYAKWSGDGLLSSGNTELFKYDVLNLDT